MPSTGYIQVRAFASYAQLPLRDVAVTITAEDGTAIAMRLTNRSSLTPAVSIPTPDRIESETPNPSERPYTTIRIQASKSGYEQINADNVQVFSGVTTIQNLEMVPLSELSESWDQSIQLNTPSQNL